MSTASALRALQKMIDTACRSGGLQATSLAIHTKGETHALVAGMANVPENVPATTDTLFHIGSATKPMTAELIWRLIGDGKLTADLPVIDALPEANHIATLTNRKLTIAHLLSHTGGLDGDVFFDAGRGKDVLRQFLSRIADIGALFEPGAHFSYANVAYNILARIAEVRGGSPFEDALADMLRTKHQLSQFAILPEEKIRKRTALHFSKRGRELVPDHFGPHSNIGSGTVLAMSTGDLVRWGISLLDTGEIVRRMQQPAVRLPFNHRYEGWGYGLTLLDGLGEKLFGHDGGTANTGTFLRIAPAARAAWAFAATGPMALATYRQLEPALRKFASVAPAPKRKPEGKPPRDLKPYEGKYVRHGMDFTIKADRKMLRLIAGGSMSSPALSELKLRPLSPTVFEAELAALKATIWVSFHDFGQDGRPNLFFGLERMARRKEKAS